MTTIIEIPKAGLPTDTLHLKLKASSLGRFYLMHIKKRPALRAVVIFAWRYFHPTAQRLMIKKRTRWKSLESIDNYVSRKKLIGFQLANPCQFDVSIQEVRPLDSEFIKSKGSSQQQLPGVSVYELEQVTLHGGSNLLSFKDNIVHHNLSDYVTDYTSEELHGRLIIKPKKQKAMWLEVDAAPAELPEAAVFLDATSSNYAHWLTEVLPRIAAFCSNERFDGVPLVIDSGLHANLMQTLKIFSKGRNIYLLPARREIIVGKLYYTTACGYIPFEPRKRKFRTNGEFSPEALNIVRAAVYNEIGSGISHSPKKIFLKRNSGNRNLFNNKEVEKLVRQYGYVVIEPEKLSFEEQYTLFKNASSVIAATGAALANCLFCEARTQVTVLMPNHKEMIFNYWSNMLSPLGVEVNIIIGESIDRGKFQFHADFKIDIAELEEHLKYLGDSKTRAPKIHPTAIVSIFASIGEGVSIGPNTIIHPNVAIGENSSVAGFCELGIETPLGDKSPLIIGEGALIRSNSIFYESSSLGRGLTTGHSVIVRENTQAGCNFQIGTNTEIQGDCKIGNYVRFQSNIFVGKKTVIKDFVWILPGATLTNDPTPPSETLIGAYIEDYACISAGALILPGVHVGKASLVGAAACVTKDVPPGKVVAGNPAKVLKDTTEIQLKDGSDRPAYPWTSHFERGYPADVTSEWKKNS